MQAFGRRGVLDRFVTVKATRALVPPTPVIEMTAAVKAPGAVVVRPATGGVVNAGTVNVGEVKVGRLIRGALNVGMVNVGTVMADGSACDDMETERAIAMIATTITNSTQPGRER